jgi:glycopeptide antibiotics resistance protein
VPFLSAYTLFALLLVALIVFGVARSWAPAPLSRRATALALGGWLIALLFMTLRSAGSSARLNLVPDLGGRYFSAFDTFANVAVFLPLGLVLAAAAWRAVPVVALGMAVSVAIELTQYLLDIGRSADINDVITNSAGAALGFCLGWAIRRARSRRAHTDVGASASR